MRCFISIGLIVQFLLPLSVSAQQIVYSDYDRADNRNINFEIVGKMDEQFLVYKNIGWKHKLSIYGMDMHIKENIKLNFIPDKTFNVDFVVYPAFFYMIYQYQKKNIIHCMAVKMDGNGNKLTEPVEVDTTQISLLADNKIYSTISSEDKQKIMLYKMQDKNGKVTISTVLLDNQLQVINRSRQTMEFDERKDSYGDFLLDNNGNLVFIMENKPGVRDYINTLTLVTKAPLQDTFASYPVDLNKKYIGETKLKIDNMNGRYIINSFYYTKSRGNTEGLFSYFWDANGKAQYITKFTQLYDTLREIAKTDGAKRFAFNDYSIQQVIVKRDGGFLITAEDFYSQTRGFNNNNYWNNWYYPYSLSSNSYYFYNRYYGYYRPLSNFANQSIRYYYSNIMLLSVNNKGRVEWSKIIYKDQFDDDDDNFLSFSTMNAGDEIHFLFNGDNKNQIMADHVISPNGSLKRNATLKSMEKGYQFMPRLSKQTGARQILVPCTYRGYICFAKIDF